MLLALLLLLVGFALAQSGGGFGGSSPSSPPSGGGYGGGGYGGGDYGGYGGGYGGGGYGGGYGGYGFTPFVFGGGGGTMGVLLVGLVLFFVFQSLRRSLRVTGAGTGVAGATNAQAVKVQILMSEGDDVKRALQRIAQTGDPDTNEGLTRMLTEAALVALRHPDRWTYGTVETARAARAQADGRVAAWATEARSAFHEQTTSHYQNRSDTSAYQQRTDYQGTQGGLYLAVTIAIAAFDVPGLPTETVATSESVRQGLLAISGVQPQNLIRAEVVWSPDVEGEYLTEDEAIRKYPRLTKI